MPDMDLPRKRRARVPLGGLCLVRLDKQLAKAHGAQG